MSKLPIVERLRESRPASYVDPLAREMWNRDGFEAATTITELVSALEKARTFIDTEPALNDHNCPGAGCKKCKRRLDAFSDVNTALSNTRGDTKNDKG